jgi:hypothetical protein
MKFKRNSYIDSYDVIVDGEVIGKVHKHESFAKPWSGYCLWWTYDAGWLPEASGRGHGFCSTRKKAAEELLREHEKRRKLLGYVK